MTYRSMLVGLLCAASALQSVQAQGFLDKLKQSVGGNYTVRGRVQVQDRQWLTCFNGIKTGYLGASDMARPGDAKTDPATGTVKVTTAAIPTVIMTRGGVVTPNNCDTLAEQQLLVADIPATAGTTGKSDTGYRDDYGCTKPEWTSDEIVRRRNEIMECQSDAITERAAQRAQARSAGAGGAAPATNTNAEQQAANLKLQQETAEKFKAIQSQAAVPASATTQSDEDMAWDGAKLCNLKPAYMMKLKEEAVTFVRYEKASGKTVMSELSGGARREVTLDGNAFAQRISFNAQAIGQGGDTCGRAFWNAEAYKAASAAMSGG